MKKFLCLVIALAFVFAFGFTQNVQAQKETPKLKVFIHYPNPDNHGKKPSGPVCSPTSNDQVPDYSKAGWTLPSTFDYQINYATVPANLNDIQIQTAISASFETWENAQKEITLTEGKATNVTRYYRDDINAVLWGKTPGNAIAVTYIWYYPSTGQVAEIDMVFNSRLAWDYTPYTGDCAGNPNAYDLQDIATHEFGHWVGLDDLYSSADKDLTMYGYGTKGELKKDTLGLGDLLGAQSIY